MSETPMTPAEAAKRLDQYGTEATFRVATYGSGNERALHEIGLTLRTEVDRLRARIEELTSQRDDLLVEDALAEQQRDETFVPRTERSYWAAIADALNAAVAVGMPVGIDLDGTLTDRNAWSVVWDREAERWTVAGYDDGAERDDDGKDTRTPGESTRRPLLDPRSYEAPVQRAAARQLNRERTERGDA